MATETRLTPAPWGWQKFGKEWCLVGQHSMRPIVLSVMVRGPGKGHLTSLVGGLLEPFDPDHPDACAIAAAAEMLEALEGIAPYLDHIPGGIGAEIEACREAIRKARGRP